MTEPRAATIEVPVSGGTVTVRRVKWAGYVAIKNLVVATLSGPAIETVFSLLQGPIAGFLAGLASQVPDAEPQSLAEYAEAAAPSAEAPKSATDRFAGAAALFAARLPELLEQVQSQLPRLLQEASLVGDKLAEVMLAHAIDPADRKRLDGADWEEVGKVIDAAYQLNDPATLLEREKNFWAAVAASGRRILNRTPSPGTSISNSD